MHTHTHWKRCLIVVTKTSSTVLVLSIRQKELECDGAPRNSQHISIKIWENQIAWGNFDVPMAMASCAPCLQTVIARWSYVTPLHNGNINLHSMCTNTSKHGCKLASTNHNPHRIDDLKTWRMTWVWYFSYPVLLSQNMHSLVSVITNLIIKNRIFFS